jgi:ribosomal protein L37E
MSRTKKTSGRDEKNREEDEILEDSDLQEDEDEVELSEIPIEQFLKDPKMSMITEETDVEETTAWCPVCSDHTIFVDGTCTVCGFTKSSKKTKNKDEETEESSENTFELMPNEEIIDEMGFYGSGYDDEERDDY